MKFIISLFIILILLSCEDKRQPITIFIRGSHTGVVVDAYEAVNGYAIYNLDSGQIYHETTDKLIWQIIRNGDTIINKKPR
jgi:hypothetical protein